MGSLGAIDSVVCISSWLLGHIHIHNTYTIDNPLLCYCRQNSVLSKQGI